MIRLILYNASRQFVAELEYPSELGNWTDAPNICTYQGRRYSMDRVVAGASEYVEFADSAINLDGCRKVR